MVAPPHFVATVLNRDMRLFEKVLDSEEMLKLKLLINNVAKKKITTDEFTESYRMIVIPHTKYNNSAVIEWATNNKGEHDADLLDTIKSFLASNWRTRRLILETDHRVKRAIFAYISEKKAAFARASGPPCDQPAKLLRLEMDNIGADSTNQGQVAATIVEREEIPMTNSPRTFSPQQSAHLHQRLCKNIEFALNKTN